MKIGPGILKFCENMILLFRNPVLVIELSPLNKKINGKKICKICNISGTFYPIDFKFFHNIALIFKLSILHTIGHDNYYGIVQH